LTDSYEGKVAVITGGGSGIGRALCRAFAGVGARVLVADIDLVAAQETVALLNGAPCCEAERLDVASEDSWAKTLAKVEHDYGRCDVLCNNAGVMRVGPFADADVGDWIAQVNVNARGVILGCRTMLPMMLERGEGLIVNTASLAGLAPWPEGALYTASKYAVVGFSEALRAELADTGIHLAVLCPGGVDTPMNDGFEPEEDERRIPPEEVARLVLDGLAERRDWIFTHAEYLPFLEERFAGIMADHDPLT